MIEWLILLFSVILTLGFAAWITEMDWRRLIVECQVWWLDAKRDWRARHQQGHIGGKLIDEIGELAQMSESGTEQRAPLQFRRR